MQGWIKCTKQMLIDRNTSKINIRKIESSWEGQYKITKNSSVKEGLLCWQN